MTVIAEISNIEIAVDKYIYLFGVLINVCVL